MAKWNVDNPVFQAMGRLGDIVVLNLAWALCCLPVVTAGASTAALLTVARRLVSGEECPVGRSFFRAFRQNWGQATRTWLILLAALALFAADLIIAFQTPGALGSIFRGTALALLGMWLAVSGNAFALLSRYEYHPARVIADAALLAVRHPLSALTSVALAVWMPLLALYDLNTALYLLLPWSLAGGAVWALALSAALLPAFRRLEEKKGDDSSCRS